MPILNKLEYLDETKQQIKNTLNTKFNSQITDEDTFRSYVDKIKNIYTNWPKVTGEGTNITLNNTKKGRLGLEPTGDLSQETTTGKNIIDYENLQPIYTSASTYSIINNGIRITANSAGTYRVIGFNLGETANLIGKVLRFKCDFVASGQNIGAYGLGYCDANGENRLRKAYTSTSGTAIQMTVDNTNTNIYLLLYENVEGSSSANDYVDFTNIIGTVDNEDMSYELYTGNQPSPSPNYPQVIKVVTGDQNIKVINKNLNPTPSNKISSNVTFTCKDTTLTINGTNNSYVYGPYVPITLPAGTYTLCYKYLSGTVVDNGFQININPATSSTIITALNRSITNYTSNASTTFTLTESQTIRVFLYTGNATRTFNDLKIDIQLVKGTETDYNMVAHQEQNYPLSLGSLELAKIGDYKDYIYRENGKWYKYGLINKLIFTGNENWQFVADNHTAFLTTVLDYKISNDIICKSNYFIGANNVGSSANIPNKTCCFYANHFVYRLYFRDDNLNSSSDFKSFLQSKYENGIPVIMYYILETPIITEITDTTLISQLDNLYNANSYDDTTIIFIAGDLPVVMSASALMKGGA